MRASLITAPSPSGDLPLEPPQDPATDKGPDDPEENAAPLLDPEFLAWLEELL